MTGRAQGKWLLYGWIVAAALVAGSASVPPALAADSAPSDTSQKARNLRYCEIFVLTRKLVRISAAVYNTIGLNDCPEDKWSAISSDALKKQFDAVAIVMNGPRYFVMDTMASSDASAKVVDFMGLPMRQVAVLDIPMSETQENRKPYQVQTVKRTTDWGYATGQPVFELVDDKNNVYVMQSYSEIVDPKLTYDQLSALGARLKLPAGWQYRVVTLDKDMDLKAAGEAHVVQDDLENTYQRVEP